MNHREEQLMIKELREIRRDRERNGREADEGESCDKKCGRVLQTVRTLRTCSRKSRIRSRAFENKLNENEIRHILSDST